MLRFCKIRNHVSNGRSIKFGFFKILVYLTVRKKKTLSVLHSTCNFSRDKESHSLVEDVAERVKYIIHYNYRQFQAEYDNSLQ